MELNLKALEGYSPYSLLRKFAIFCGVVSRQSENEKDASDFIARQAEVLGLRYQQDDMHNIIVYKNGSPGRELEEAIIIQSHLDMVCVAYPEGSHNFATDPIEIYVENGKIKAKNTTLGADNGIGVATLLDLMHATEISHPPLKLLFTTAEEVGFFGAKKLNLEWLKGTMLINLDSEDGFESVCVGCAGGSQIDLATFNTAYEKAAVDGHKCSLTIKGLRGGHSGVQIHENRHNAIVMMTRLCHRIKNDGYDIRLIDINGGIAMNAIPTNASITFMLGAHYSYDVFANYIQDLETEQKKYATEEVDMAFELEHLPIDIIEYVLTDQSQKNILGFFSAIPNGVIQPDEVVNDIVHTSSNVGVIKTDNNKIAVTLLVRSVYGERLHEVVAKIVSIGLTYGFGLVKDPQSYVPWEPKNNSHLLSTALDLFKDLYNEEMKVYTVHAGLECSAFAEKNPDLDMISLGSKIGNPHTIDEEADIESIDKYYNFLILLLASISKEEL